VTARGTSSDGFDLQQETIMTLRKTALVAFLAVACVVLGQTKAEAQFIQNTASSYNGFTGQMSVYNNQYSPVLGNTFRSGSVYNNYTGLSGNYAVYNNPFWGIRGRQSSYYNPYTNVTTGTNYYFNPFLGVRANVYQRFGR
jgi:hypothetical protein